MKEKYTTLTEFIDDILKAAEVMPKEETINRANNKNVINKKYTNCSPSGKEEGIQYKNINDKSFSTFNDTNVVETRNIEINTDDIYTLHEMVNGIPTYRTQNIIFNHIDKYGYEYPGITNNQLLAILRNRYKNDPKKLNLVLQLMQ